MIQDVAPPPRKRPSKPRPIKTPEASPESPQALPIVAKDFEEPGFITPEEVAQEATDTNPEPEQPITATKRKKWPRLWRPQGRKAWIITISVVVVVLGGAGAAARTVLRPTHPQVVPKAAVAKKVVPPPVPIYSTLSGLQVTDPTVNQKPVTAVMIENSTDARPQSGLSDAGVVFEALAEGGITRFMALFQDTAPSNIGPVRSARPYYVQWALGFNAAYAHAGGSPEALSDIPSWHVQDINLLNYGSPYGRRISTRLAPHNLYSGVPDLNSLESSKGYASTYTGFPRATKEVPLAQPTASTITLSVSGPAYNPQYTYDAAANAYKRSTDGTPDTDANTGKQIEPKVVIAIVVPLSRGALDASGAYYSDYNVLGSGTAYIFQNGGVTVGQWSKADNASQITFADSTGVSIPLNRGQTWITAVSAANQVQYQGVPQTPSTAK